MRVTSMRLINYRSFADSESIELDQINVLVGRNNAGKSTIIRALYLLQSGSADPSDVRLNSELAEIKIELAEISEPSLVQYVPANSPSEGTVALRLRRDGRYATEAQYGSNTVAFNQFPGREPENFIYPYLSKRKVTEFTQSVNLTTTMAVGPNMAHIVSKVSRLSNAAHPLYEEYRAACRQVLGFDITAFASPGGHQAGMIVDRFNNIPLEAMGEGVSSLLALITDLRACA